jgi:Protein of unknown function (DUF4435)
VSESLLYEGTILVEGDDDVAFLEEGFPQLLRKFKIKDRGGRREVEKAIAEIQALEKKGQKVAPIYLIFDRDDEPTELNNSNCIKILQWPRRCIENYMLDVDVISELLKDPSITRATIQSEGEVRKLLRDLAYQQLDLIAARETYKSYGYLDASLTKSDMKEKELSKLAEAFFQRMANARTSIPEIDQDAWLKSFLHAAEQRRNELLLMWEGRWRDLCDGKKLISDLHKATSLKMSESTFKTRITQRMRETSSETWRAVNAILKDFIQART